MRSNCVEPLVAARLLLDAFRSGPEFFEVAVMEYASRPRPSTGNPGSQEYAELLDHLVLRLTNPTPDCGQAMVDACIFLLEHLAARVEAQGLAAPTVFIQ